MATSTKAADKAADLPVVDTDPDQTSSDVGTIISRTVPATPAYELFVPESTRENYRQIARDIATAEGSTPKAALAKLGKGFAQQHETDPQAGWGHLAQWAEDEGDPGDGLGANLTEINKAKAVESALRDPAWTMPAVTEAQEAAEIELARRADQSTAPAAADLNTGPAIGVDTGDSAHSADQSTVGPFAGDAPEA